jgi:DNA repair exonuclease SbcCD nuclease subunit
MALDLPNAKPPYMEAEATPELVPEGFNYYAGGHIHKPYLEQFKKGLLAYSGCTETNDYDEAEIKKGFYYVRVDENRKISPEFIELQSPRRFVILEQDYSGLNPSRITDLAVELVKGADEDGVILIPVLKGILPAEASRAEVDVARIRTAAEKALFVHPVTYSLRESEVSEELVRSIFESEFKDLKTKAFEYFLQIFQERYTREEAEKIARTAVSLIEPLTKKEEAKVKQTIEELLH